MNPALVGLLAFIFVGMTMINRVLEGQLVSSLDVSALKDIALFTPVDVAGLFSISVPNLSFLTSGIPRLLSWDYGFFGGNAGIVVYLLYSINAAVLFGLLVLAIGLAYQYFRRV